MKREEEFEVVSKMIKLYCKRKHKTQNGLCEECQELQSYVKQRLQNCPHGDNKPFCSNCEIHCYKPEMKEKIKKVMKFTGPRMIFYNPKLVIKHIKSSKKCGK